MPQPGDDTVLVSMLEAGVCGTDEELNSGIIGEAPAGSDFLIIGHENLGRVAAVGKNVRTPAWATSWWPRCAGPARGMCFACRVGEPDLCNSGDYFERGIKGMHGYMAQQYVESPEYLVRVPPELEKGRRPHRAAQHRGEGGRGAIQDTGADDLASGAGPGGRHRPHRDARHLYPAGHGAGDLGLCHPRQRRA